ncbi:hypothetical protein LPB136_11190 [Tenacibaculum todarodis]|uniref:Uncharacterized protein n=1 Tax=Tenacibaculum todarodis TaxID=1850252 RepID=A0A1L3JL61_9FLAO|nr:hypothetical protein [Tenacibaculum todarodis]APG65896.1 hypothetical protein LPB136_11190 [Tenacibaculum todarodis]
MKKHFLIVLFLISILTYSQEKIQEPNFIGEAFILKSDNTPLVMEKQNVKLRTGAGFSIALVTVAKTKTKIRVEGCCSTAIYNPENEIKIVVRAVDNETDPMSIVNIFKFKRKKKKRLAELASYGIWSSSTNNLDLLKFKGEKYGEKSYLLTINKFDRDSEYGIIVTNPNSLDEKRAIVSTFAIK